ncbi:MAG: peptide deformylase [bacterium]
MILKIETGQYNPILRQKAKEVKEINAEIKQLILNMIETMNSDDNIIGLAAPQVNHSLQIIVIGLEQNKNSIVLINPEIKNKSFIKSTIVEGCLSLPNLNIPVKRPNKIIINALNAKGQKIKIKTKGVLARIIQHEIDHLNGVLIIDKKI